MDMVILSLDDLQDIPDWYDEPKRWHVKEIPESDKFDEWGLKCVVSWDSEVFWNESTGLYILRWFKVECECGHVWSPLMSPYTRVLWSGWHWVGQSHQEPVTRYTTTCRVCSRRYAFEITVGQ